MTLALVFPGQGSQSVGMMADLSRQHREIVSATFGEASSILGFDLMAIVTDGPRERLDDTEVTQPAMLAAGVATWRVWRDLQGPVPILMAGHSLGEYTALVCAGALNFDAAVGLVQRRARAMQSAVPAGTGAMAALLGLDDTDVESLCRESSTAGDSVEPVNYNSPGQVVIAGHVAAVEKAITAARARGARRAVLLPVSVPSHSSLMKPAAEVLAEAVADVAIRMPEIDVVSSVRARLYRDVASIRSDLVAQVHQPVHWVGTVQRIVEAGCTDLVECGPGKVLTGLNRRITRGKDVRSHALTDSNSIRQVLSTLGAA